MGFIHEGLPLFIIENCIFVLQRCRGRTSRILSVHVSKTTSKRKRGTKIE